MYAISLILEIVVINLSILNIYKQNYNNLIKKFLLFTIQLIHKNKSKSFKSGLCWNSSPRSNDLRACLMDTLNWNRSAGAGTRRLNAKIPRGQVCRNWAGAFETLSQAICGAVHSTQSISLHTAAAHAVIQHIYSSARERENERVDYIKENKAAGRGSIIFNVPLLTNITFMPLHYALMN